MSTRAESEKLRHQLAECQCEKDQLAADLAEVTEEKEQLRIRMADFLQIHPELVNRNQENRNVEQMNQLYAESEFRESTDDQFNRILVENVRTSEVEEMMQGSSSSLRQDLPHRLDETQQQVEEQHDVMEIVHEEAEASDEYEKAETMSMSVEATLSGILLSKESQTREKERRNEIVNDDNAENSDADHDGEVLATSENEDSVQCHHCPKKFISQWYLDRHLISLEKKFVCSLCGKKFAFDHGRKTHEENKICQKKKEKEQEMKEKKEKKEKEMKEKKEKKEKEMKEKKEKKEKEMKEKKEKKEKEMKEKKEKKGKKMTM